MPHIHEWSGVKHRSYEMETPSTDEIHRWQQTGKGMSWQQNTLADSKTSKYKYMWRQIGKLKA